MSRKKEKNFTKKFAIMHFLDEVRWKVENAGGVIFNCCSSFSLSCNEKILTHWLLYITERQMPFEQIWDKGGIVFTQIVREYTRTKNMHVIDISSNVANGRDTFFGKDGKKDIYNNETYSFTSKIPYDDLDDKARERVRKYYSSKERKANPIIEFKSRFFTTDYLSMFYTLHTLSSFEHSIVKYMATVVEMILSSKNIDPKNKITLDKNILINPGTNILLGNIISNEFGPTNSLNNN